MEQEYKGQRGKVQAYEDKHGKYHMTQPVSAYQAMPIQRTRGPTWVPVLPSTARVRRPEAGEKRSHFVKQHARVESTRPVLACASAILFWSFFIKSEP